MLIYNIILAISVFGILYTFKNDNKANTYNNFLYYILSGIILLVVCLHGENVGHDTHEYMYLYLHPNDMEFNYIEVVLPALASILRNIYANKYFINFCILLIAQIPVFLLINKYSKNRFYSIFLYITYTTSVSMFLHSMSAVRQSLAIGFFAYSVYVYLNNNEKITFRFILSVSLMLFTHISSFLALPLFLIVKKNLSKRVYYLGTILAIIFGISINTFIESLIKYLILIEKDFYLSGNSAESTILTVIPFAIPFLYIVYTLPVEKLQTIWIKGMFCLVIVVGMLFPIAFNLDRIVAYYCLMSIFAIPELFSIKHYSIKKFVFYIFNIGIMFYFSYKYYKVFEILSDMDYPYAPYNTFL